MNNTTIGYNDNAVVKTIYDPCPAGFKMPASNAFTGFTTTGINTETESQFNINGGWDFGFHFNNKISSPDATVYFPASGVRSNENGSLNNVDRHGYYWSAVPLNTSYGSCTRRAATFGRTGCLSAPYEIKARIIISQSCSLA